jgi:hypothetical protein
MGPLNGVRSVAPAAGVSPPAGSAASAAEQDAGIPLALAPPGSGRVGQRPLAAFVTHLIATAQDAPQTRRHRRAALKEAVSAYAAAALLIERAGARGNGGR